MKSRVPRVPPCTPWLKLFCFCARNLRNSSVETQSQHRCPRLWRAIFTTHRAPHPRTKSLLRRSAVQRHARRDSQLLARRHHSFGRPVVGLRQKRAAWPTSASSRSAFPCSASATDCSSWSMLWAAKSPPPQSASTDTPKLKSSTPTRSSLKDYLRNWKSGCRTATPPKNCRQAFA